MQLGYATGAFDLFHVGHLNLLRAARSLCERLIVGVSTDELILASKSVRCAVPLADRMAIVQACRHVDAAIPQDDLDKYAAWERLHYDILFVGDDWHGEPKWQEYERKLAPHGVRVVYLPYTRGVSSTMLRPVATGRAAG
jgi:glycerol-3-phosphate cytidylyltransferase